MYEYIAVTLFILYIDGNIYLWYSVIVEEGTQLCRRPAHSINAAADLRSGYFIAPGAVRVQFGHNLSAAVFVYFL